MSARKSPKVYEPRRFWWIGKPKYLAIFLREFTSFFILAYVITFSFQLIQLSRGEAAYRGLLASLSSPVTMALSILLLVLASYHSATWFLLVPKVQPIKIGGRLLPQRRVVLAWVGGWLFASYLVVFFVFR